MPVVVTTRTGTEEAFVVTAREYGDELLRRLLDHATTATGALGAGLSLVIHRYARAHEPVGAPGGGA